MMLVIPYILDTPAQAEEISDQALELMELNEF
jgi:hypothetical protein